ncbi:hypothetical protein Tco_1014593, partial [Tanacetum coccineum]
MDPYNHSTPTSTKLPILDTGKFEQWKFRIQQYLQHEHYALWEVIEFGESYKAPPEETSKGVTGEGSAKKKGRRKWEEQFIREQGEKDAEIARAQAEKELRMMIAELDRINELIVKYMTEYEQAEADLSLEEKMELITKLIMYQRNL